MQRLWSSLTNPLQGILHPVPRSTGAGTWETLPEELWAINGNRAAMMALLSEFGGAVAREARKQHGAISPVGLLRAGLPVFSGAKEVLDQDGTWPDGMILAQRRSWRKPSLAAKLPASPAPAVLLLDSLAATGGTLRAACSLLRMHYPHARCVLGVAIVTRRALPALSYLHWRFGVQVMAGACASDYQALNRLHDIGDRLFGQSFWCSL